MCKGTEVVTQCTTTTSDGFLVWRNSSGSSFLFDDAASVNDTGTLGSMTMILDSIDDSVGNASVYTSTASDIIMEETNFICSDGDVPERIDISANSKLAEKSCLILIINCKCRSIHSLMGTLSMQVLSKQSAVVLESTCCCSPMLSILHSTTVYRQTNPINP